MEDFAERLKAQLGEADRIHHDFMEERRQAEIQREVRLHELRMRIQRRFEETANASGDRIAYRTIPVNVTLQHVLTWRRPAPLRQLVVWIDADNERLLWGWGVPGPDSPRQTVLQFELEAVEGVPLAQVGPRHLDELILAFADQSRWQSDRPPAFSLDGAE